MLSPSPGVPGVKPKGTGSRPEERRADAIRRIGCPLNGSLKGFNRNPTSLAIGWYRFCIEAIGLGAGLFWKYAGVELVDSQRRFLPLEGVWKSCK